jgi:hypothetical protein
MAAVPFVIPAAPMPLPLMPAGHYGIHKAVVQVMLNGMKHDAGVVILEKNRFEVGGDCTAYERNRLWGVAKLHTYTHWDWVALMVRTGVKMHLKKNGRMCTARS